MKIKRILSAIAALAVSVSAFAGLATVASAATTQNPETDGVITWTIGDEATTTAQTTITCDTLTIGLGTGDSITSGVISYTGSSVKEENTSNYQNLSKTNRYILVTAPENGDISFKAKFTGGSQSNNRIFGQKVEGDLDLSYWNKSTGGTPIVTSLKKNVETTVTVSDVKKGEKYIFYGYQNAFNISDISFAVSSGYEVTFTETNGADVTITVSDGTVLTAGESAFFLDGDYTFTATAEGYEDYTTGSFTVSGAAQTVSFTMEALSEAGTVTVKYVDAEGAVINTVNPDGVTRYIGDEYTYYYPAYYEYNGDWYKADTTDSGVFGETITLTADNVEKTVNYSKSDITYYADAEDLSSSKSAAASASGTSYSKGKAVRLQKSSYAYTDVLSATDNAKYTVTVAGECVHNGCDYDLYARDAQGNNTSLEASVAWTTNEDYGVKTAEVVVPAGSRLVLYNTNTYNSNVLLDYVAVTFVEVVPDNAVTFAEEVQFDPDATATTGTLRFKAAITEKNFTAQKYGFKFVNFSSESDSIANHPSYTGDSSIDTIFPESFVGDVDVNDVFYHDITGIPQEVEGVKVTGVGFYAVPYVYGTNGQFYYGTPFTFEAEFDWSLDIMEEIK